MNWRRFFHREAADAEQRQELTFHLDVMTEEFIARGMDPAAARAAAQRKLGNPTRIREEIYEMNSLQLGEDAVRDVRHTLRLIRSHPGFAATVLVSLALGIGANTAMFSVIYGVLWQPLPYPAAEALVGVYNRVAFQGQVYLDASLSPGMYAACRRECRVFEHFGVWSAGAATVTGAGGPENVSAITLTQDTLPALGQQPRMGRWFTPEEDTPGGKRTVLLSHGYWQRRFGGDPAIVGRVIPIDFRPHEVIGVMPEQFRFLDRSTDVFLAQRFASERPDEFSYNGLGRLRSGLTAKEANEDLARVWRSWGEQEKITRILEELGIQPNVRPLRRDVIGDADLALYAVMGALSVLLLLVGANVASLVMVRTQTRRQEFAVRVALGAGWGRLVREQMAEGLTFGLLGGGLGLAVAALAIPWLVANGPAELPRLREVTVGPMAVAFALGCSLGASLLFGLAAILKMRWAQRLESLRGATRGREHLRAQRLLVVGQVAMALVLVVASGLLLRTLWAIQNVQPGFTEPDTLQTVRLSIPEALAKEPERVIQMQKAMLDQLAAIPGVRSVGMASGLPLEENQNGILVAVEGKTDPEKMPPNRRHRHASPGLFGTQGTRLLAGRDFDWNDVFQQQRRAVVSEKMARESWGSIEGALGKRIRIGKDAPWSEVIGVVEDIHVDGLHLPAPATVYERAGVEGGRVRRSVSVVVRSPRAGSQGLLQEMAAAVERVSPGVPLAQVRTLGEALRRSMARTALTVVLLGGAAGMALVVALLGVYGILAYAVEERRREVGIRLALGATPGAVLGIFVRQGMGLALVGGVVGLGAAAGMSRWIASLLFGVEALDPVTYGVAVGAVGLAALGASYWPARRAAGVDPMETLRVE